MHLFKILSFVSLAFATQSFANNIPVYQKFNGAYHFYSKSYNEGLNVGYWNEGVAFYVRSNSNFGATLPLYRCVVPGTSSRFVSHQPNCEGQVYEGFLGYSWHSQVEGTYGLHRCFRAGDHLATTSPGTCASLGYSYVGPLGYVPFG